MVMAPVSLTFLSVPVSSWASACVAQKVAAITRPIVRRRFIRLSSAWIIVVQPTAIKAWIGPKQRNRISACYAIGPSSHAMAGPLHGRRRTYLQKLLVGIRVRRVGGLGELVLQLCADRRVQVQALRRDLLGKPFV